MINLLPQAQKEELRERRNQRLTIILGILSSFFFISLILGLLATHFYISGQNLLQKTISQVAERFLEDKAQQELKQEIIKLNQSLKRLKAFDEERVRLRPTLEKLSEIASPRLVLTSLSYRSETTLFNLTGFALKREDLIAFQDELERAEEFSQVSFPPSNWVRAEAITFSANFKLNLKP